MITSSILIIFGLLLLLYCADRMIMFADIIAKEFSLSPILIGLTIVAFGTSAPELVITIVASLKDIPVTDAIIGNVIGSNIANLILILGVSAIFFKIDLGKIKNATNAYSLDLFKYLGLQETAIGVSVLAIGTSLPELATVILAYIKKKGAIGIGNVIGSNIMNILFVFFPGLLIIQSRGLIFNIPENSILHIYALMLSTITVIILSLFKIKIGKLVALIFTGSYATYIWYIV